MFFTKNQRLKKCLKTMVGKYTMRTKYCVFYFEIFKPFKHYLIKDELIPNTWAGFPNLNS